MNTTLARKRNDRMPLLKRLTPVAAALLLSLALLPARATAAPEGAAPAAAHESAAAGEAEHNYALVPSSAEDVQGALPTAIWVVVIFLVLLAVLYPTAWKNVMSGLKVREERIRKDLADAEAARLAAEQRQKDLEQRLAAAEAQVRDIIAKGTADAERIATGIKQQATDDVQAQRDRATKEIESAKNQALAEVYEQTANLATSVAEKILRRNLNPNDQKDLVQQSLQQLQNING